MATLLERTCNILNCSEKYVYARLHRIGLSNVCTRCGGTGEFSFNQVDGNKCYGCNGRGWNRIKITRETFAQIQEKEANGEVKAYLDDLARRQAHDKWLKENGSHSLLKIWQDTEIAKYYDWSLAIEGREDSVPEYVAISKINAMMHTAYTRATDAELERLRAVNGKGVYPKEQLINELQHAHAMMNEATFAWSAYVEEHQPEKLR